MKILKKLLGLLCLFSLSVKASNVSSLAYATTNVTTSAYVTLVASTPIPSAHIQICDTSTQVLKIAYGAAGSEIDLCTVQVSGCVIVPTGLILLAGSRLSIKAISASATSGFNTVSLLP